MQTMLITEYRSRQAAAEAEADPVDVLMAEAETLARKGDGLSKHQHFARLLKANPQALKRHLELWEMHKHR